MKFFSAIRNGLKAFNRSLFERSDVSVSDPDAWRQLFGGEDSEAGEPITPERALSIAAVWQAVDMISGDVSILPLNYKRIQENNFKTNESGRIQRMVSLQANEETSSAECWRRATLHALLWGNGYIFVETTLGGELTGEMFNLLPDRTFPRRDDESGKLFYVTELGSGDVQAIPARNILHIKGLSITPGSGCKLVSHARDCFGLSLAAQNFNSKFFSNGMQAGGILEIPVSMTQTARDNLEEDFGQRTGKSNWFKTVVLRDGAKFHQTLVDPERGQLHELREDQVREIARYFKIPVFKLGLEDASGYNTAEQAQLIYLTSTIEHWLSAITSECNLKLLTIPQKDRGTHIFEHDVSRLLRTDAKTQAEIFLMERQGLARTGNEWRSAVGLPESDDPNADVLLNPNTLSLDNTSDDDQEAVESPEIPQEPNEDAMDVVRRLLQKDVERATRATLRAIKNTTKRTSRFTDFIDQKSTEMEDVWTGSVETSFKIADRSNAMESIKTGIFDHLRNALGVFLDNPYSAKDLRQNVADKCDQLHSDDEWMWALILPFFQD